MKKRAFTLIELILVILIIAILAGIVLFSIGAQAQKSRDSRRKADLRQLQTALQAYYMDSQYVYPTTGNLGLLATKYIASVPTDPKTKELYTYVSDGKTYSITARLESETPNVYIVKVEN